MEQPNLSFFDNDTTDNYDDEPIVEKEKEEDDNELNDDTNSDIPDQIFCVKYRYKLQNYKAFFYNKIDAYIFRAYHNQKYNKEGLGPSSIVFYNKSDPESLLIIKHSTIHPRLSTETREIYKYMRKLKNTMELEDFLQNIQQYDILNNEFDKPTGVCDYYLSVFDCHKNFINIHTVFNELRQKQEKQANWLQSNPRTIVKKQRASLPASTRYL